MYFTSSREKRFWLFAALVAITIFLTLFVGKPLEKYLMSQNLQAVLFLGGMALVALTIFSHGAHLRIREMDFAILIGLVAIYFMFFFRLGAPERSHLIEYSVLAVFIHGALAERANHFQFPSWRAALLAGFITIAIGSIDESLQIFLPHRVFDVNDIIFNGLVAILAIGASMILNKVQLRLRKKA